MLSLLAIIACVGLAHGAGLNVNRCAGGLPETSYVEISGCTTTPCYLIRGTDVSGRIEFQTPFGTRTLQPRVRFTVGSGSGEFPMPEEFMDACEHLVGSMCPLSVAEDVTWKLTMPVLEEYPAETTLILEISLLGDLDRVVTCFEIPTVVL